MKLLLLSLLILSIGIPGIVNAHAERMNHDEWVFCMMVYTPFGEWACGADPSEIRKCVGYIPGTTHCIAYEP